MYFHGAVQKGSEKEEEGSVSLSHLAKDSLQVMLEKFPSSPVSPLPSHCFTTLNGTYGTHYEQSPIVVYLEFPTST